MGYILTVMRPNEPVKTLTAENHKKMQLALKHEFDRDEFHEQVDGVRKRKTDRTLEYKRQAGDPE